MLYCKNLSYDRKIHNCKYVQGGTFSFIVPTIAILSLDKWRCNYEAENMEVGPMTAGLDITPTNRCTAWHLPD
jgi:hypothetical protein